ncbi:MAG: site-2 protease family protein [Elusimicrobia bacterium]|nr:site-2 protease family protein [Elusimicrobiota bacterium]
MDWIILLPILFFSIVVHEFSHGWMAHRHGDDTAYLSGRLTFNPLPHIDLWGTILLPVLCRLLNAPLIGWAKPVPVNPNRLHHPRSDMVRVALIGPVSNLSLALMAAILYRLTVMAHLFPADFELTLMRVLFFTVQLNLSLAFFNLIPVHPLDGSQVVSGLLPYRWLAQYERHAPYGFYIILILLYTNALGVLVGVPVQMSALLLVRMGLLG